MALCGSHYGALWYAHYRGHYGARPIHCPLTRLMENLSWVYTYTPTNNRTTGAIHRFKDRLLLVDPCINNTTHYSYLVDPASHICLS